MSIQKIIQESINKNPLEVKEALAEELRNRVAEAIAAKMEEVDLDEAVSFKKTDSGDHHIHFNGKPVGKITKTSSMGSSGYSVRIGGNTSKHEVSDESSLKAAKDSAKWHLTSSESPVKIKEEVDLDEAVEVRHDRYMRSHGKKARDSGHPGNWMFTHKEYGTPDYNDSKEVHSVRGKFADAKKSAQNWAKENGHRSVYVMETVEQIDELKRSTLASYVKKAAGVGHRNTLPNAMRDRATAAAIGDKEWYKQSGRNADNRSKGIQRAADRLAKE